MLNHEIYETLYKLFTVSAVIIVKKINIYLTFFLSKMIIECLTETPIFYNFNIYFLKTVLRFNVLNVTR